MAVIVILMIATCSMAVAYADSTATKPLAPRSHWRLSARLHSKGIFNYGGRQASGNPTFDVSFTYDRKQWGLFVFKGVDLADHHTFYNFALISAYKNFKLAPSVTFTPYVGSFLEEATGFADRGSDAVVILITTKRLGTHWAVEHMGLFSNLLLEPEQRDWVNRLRFTYTGKHWDIISSTWWNNQMFDHSSYWTAGLNVAYSRMRVGEHMFMSVGITGLTTLDTSEKESNATKNTLMLTVSSQWLH